MSESVPLTPEEELDAIMRPHDEAEKRLAYAIGKFCLDFSVLEKHIVWAIACLLPIDNVRKMQLLLGPIVSVDTRLNIMQSIVKGRKTKPVSKEILEIIKEIRTLTTYRNELIHGDWSGWSPNDDAFGKWYTTTRDKFKRYHKQFRPTEIVSQSEKCFPLVVRLSKAVKEYQES